MRINGEDWAFCLVPPGDPALCTSLNCALGVCDDNDKTIYILNNLTREKMRKVLCHEIVHAAMFSYNTDLDWRTEEIVADIIATYGDEIGGETDRVFEYLMK